MIGRVRSGGVLLHPTSLPGPFGIGDLGPEAHRFVDFLAEAGMTRWQILPLGPPGYGGSPYAAESSFAGNEAMLSPELLVRDGLLDAAAIADPPSFDPHRLDYEAVNAFKQPLFREAWNRFSAAADHGEFEAFRQHAAEWLEDFALFRAIKRKSDGRAWNTWDPPLRLREQHAIDHARRDLADEMHYQCFLQWIFDRQWEDLRSHAHLRGILIIGDIPMFPSLDSADVWGGQHLFKLDNDGQPTVVAGVPPDYFSETGQLWGNPHYDWPRHAADGYSWWDARFRWTFHRTDIVRIDHFRGFQAAWEVPGGAETAIKGEWVDGPGIDLFSTLGLVSRPAIIAEDLGTITPDVLQLRDDGAYPGMTVLHFAFGGSADNPYLPHNHVRNSVVYTGTHDNDTTVGWLHSLDRKTKRHLREYVGKGSASQPDALIRMAFASVGDTAIIPMQDVLLLDSESRMNTPSQFEGSWTWRFDWSQLEPSRTEWLRSLNELYDRLSEPGEEAADEPAS